MVKKSDMQILSKLWVYHYSAFERRGTQTPFMWGIYREIFARAYALGNPHVKNQHCAISQLMGRTWVNTDFIKTCRSQAVCYLTLAVQVSNFGQRETRSRLCLRTKTRLRNTNKNCTRYRERGGWINVDQWPGWAYSGSPHKSWPVTSHLSWGTG